MFLENNLLCFFLIILSMFLFMKYYNHILMVLISLEFIVVSIYFMIFFCSSSFLESFMLFYLLFSVCESVLGLGLLIVMIHYYGNEKFKIMNVNLW